VIALLAMWVGIVRYTGRLDAPSPARWPSGASQ
jgi:hypothetical protein